MEQICGPVPEGKVVRVKNGLRRDCAIENLHLTTKSQINRVRRNPFSKPVVKLDQGGNVVALYSSAADAAKANYCSKSAMRYHCAGKAEDKYSLDGYEYRYEERGKGRKKKVIY